MMDAVDRALNRIIEGAPLIVAVLMGIGWVIWTTWRSERAEMLNEIRAERAARAELHQQTLAIAERSIAATQSMRDALNDLKHAIERSVGR